MDKLRYGLIGCGDISRKRVAPAFRDLDVCELVAVNRARTELAEAFAREFGARRWYDTWGELLRDDEVDAVYVATPHDQHKEQTIAAAEAGKHVLCEKPMALNARDCREMIDACRRNDVRLGVAYYRHHYPVLARIKEMAAAGELGKITLIQINAFEVHDLKPGDPKYWTFVREQSGGGPMMGFGCHRIEVMTHLLGPVAKAESVLENSLYDEREVEDNAAALLRFDSGAIGMLCVSNAVQEPSDTLDVYGSRGSVHVAVLNEGGMRVWTRDGERTEEHPPHANIHQPLIEDFTRAVLEGREPQVTGRVGLEVQQILDEIYGENGA